MILCASLLLLASVSCRTPGGLPCYTITIRREQVVLFFDGPGDLAKNKATETRAQAGDGSFASAISFTSLTWQGRTRREQREFYDAPSKFRYWLAPATRTWVRMQSHVPVHPLRPPQADAQCRPLPLSRQENHKPIGTAQVLGWQVNGWRAELPHGGYTEVWNAPALDCSTLRARTVYRNALRLPELTETVEAEAISAGEPDRSWFTVPEGYKEDEDPRYFGFGQRR